jgi:hypothetical protein
MRKNRTASAYDRIKRSMYLLCVVIIVAAVSLGALVLPGRADAYGQLGSRSLTVSSGVPSKTNVSYSFTFTPEATSTLQSMKFMACTTAVNACNPPAGLSFTGATYTSDTGFQGATSFAIDTGVNDCIASASVICVNRTDATNQTQTPRTISFGAITNQSAVNTAFFVRIATYSDNAYTLANVQDRGTTASATVQTFTANAAVAEVLNFCVGSTGGNTATAVMPADCGAVSGTSLNLGVLATSSVNVSPVTVANGGDLNNGLVMLRTNASSGATVSYDAIQAPTGTNHLGTLRILGANCNIGIVSTDACINGIGTTQATIASGVENFGMTIAATNCDSTTSYACTFAGGTYNLIRTADYDGTGANTYPTDSDQVTGTTQAGYAWDETGTAQIIASSSTFVDDEALILKFAATSAITTPFGNYSVQTDFIAVPTY